MVERAEEIYQALLGAGISEEEINQQLKEKDTEFQGFMSKQAILFLIAKEHNIDVDSSEDKEILNHITEDIIDYNDFAIPISKITEGMRNIVMTGIIKTIFPVREFIRKDGTPGLVGSFQICDKSEWINVVLWNEHVKIMENEYFKKGEIIQVIGGYSKKGREEKLEVRLSRQGRLILAPKNVVLQKAVKSESIDIDSPTIPKNQSANKQVKWTIQDLYEKEGFIKFVSGTIQKGSFKEITLKNGEKTFLLKLILSDDTSSIKVNIWGLKAVELFKVIKDGDSVRLTNIVIKENSYSNEKELSFTKNSTLEVI